MSQRPVTLFTGQWADLKIADLLPKVKAMGYEGVELACWGDHFDVVRAVNEKGYVCLLYTSDATSATSASCPPMSGATAIRKASGSARAPRWP